MNWNLQECTQQRNILTFNQRQLLGRAFSHDQNLAASDRRPKKRRDPLCLAFTAANFHQLQQ